HRRASAPARSLVAQASVVFGLAKPTISGPRTAGQCEFEIHGWGRGRVILATREIARIRSVVSKSSGGWLEYLRLCATFSDRIALIATVKATFCSNFQAFVSPNGSRNLGS